MSSYDFSEGAGPYVPQIQTSRLAILSVLSALFCVPGLSSAIAIGAGILALRQISGSRTIEGANLAWAGIFGGLLSLLIWGGIGQHVLKVRGEMNSGVQRFMAAWAKAEVDGEAEAAPGLRPLMRHGEGEVIRKTLHERLGEFQGVGEQSEFRWSVKADGEHATAHYPLQFQSGAPCVADVEMVRDEGTLRVVGFTLNSPVLRDLTFNKMNGLHGQATPDLRDYGGPADRGTHVKSFRPHD